MGPVSALLDTSMLVRYLTGDPPDLADASAKVIDAEAELLISDVALVETAYVLASTYGVPRETVVDHLIAFRLPKEHVLEALTLCRPSGRVSFADALIWAAARAADATIYPLDERFPRVKNTHRPTIVINLETPFPWTSAKIGAASRNIVRKQIRSFRYRVLDLGL
jgi:predicted nucleic acid-binding protein